VAIPNANTGGAGRALHSAQPPTMIPQAGRTGPGAFGLADPAALQLEIESTAAGVTLSAEESRRLSIIRLRKITAALVAYAVDKGRFPTASTVDNENIPALSWRVQILPYLGLQDLYSKFRLSEPFDSAHNAKLLVSIPPVFQSPSRPDTKTNYLVVTGTDTLFPPGDRRGQPPSGIIDGPGATAMLLEVDDFMAVEWTRPVDYNVVPADPRRGLAELREDGFFIGWADGTVGCWPRSAADALIPGLFSIAGKEPPARNVSIEAVAAIGSGVDRNSPVASSDPRPKAAGPETAPAGASTPETSRPDISRPTGTAATPMSMATRETAGVRNAERRATGSPTETTVDIRREPPTEEQLGQASSIVRDLYDQEFKNAKLDKDKRDFAKKLIEDVERIEADSAGRFVLLRAARDIAAKAGDVTVAIDACDRLGREFRVDLLSMKLKALEQAVVNLSAETELAPLYENSLKLGDEALKLDDFKAAQSLYRLAMNAARRGRSADREYQINLRENDLRETRVAYQRITDHVHTLVRAPEDPTANAAVGRYYLLLKRDWERGLPMVARGDNAGLRKLAEADLAQPTEAEAMVGVGDQWWDFAEKLSVETEKTSARIRARHWYEAAQPMLGASLQKIRVEKRIAEIKREVDKAEGRQAPGGVSGRRG
jgi:tetratricopeptide (TPR) repeat protein